MFCPQCGKEILNESEKFCPQCGSVLHRTAVAFEPNKSSGIGTALLLICVLFALGAVAVYLYGNFGYCIGKHHAAYWYDYEGGFSLAVLLIIIAVITGIIGIFVRKK